MKARPRPPETFANMFNRAKRLGLIKRRHRVWLRQQAAATGPREEDDDAHADIVDLFA